MVLSTNCDKRLIFAAPWHVYNPIRLSLQFRGAGGNKAVQPPGFTAVKTFFTVEVLLQKEKFSLTSCYAHTRTLYISFRQQLGAFSISQRLSVIRAQWWSSGMAANEQMQPQYLFTSRLSVFLCLGVSSNPCTAQSAQQLFISPCYSIWQAEILELSLGLLILL